MKEKLKKILRSTEKYTKTDMVYFMRGTFWLNANMVVTSLFAFVLSIAFAHFLSKEAYGLYQFALSIGSILAAFTLTGMSTAVSRSVSMGYEGSLVSSVKTRLRYGLISSAVALIIAAYYLIHDNQALALACLIIAIFLPIQNSFNTYLGLIGGKKDFRGTFWFSQALSIPYTLVMLGSLTFVSNPVLIVLINLGFNSLLTVILHFIAIKIYKPNNKIDPETISYGKHLSWIGILSTFAAQLDNILVYHFIGAAELAIYVFATTMPERVNSLGKTIGNIALPKFSTRTASELRAVILKKSLQTGALALAVSVVYIVAAPFIFKIFFPNYMSSVLYSQVYSITLAITALSALPVTALTALQARKEILLFNIFSPIISISIMLAASSLYGVWGLIISKGISSLIIFAIAIFLLSRVKDPEPVITNLA